MCSMNQYIDRPSQSFMVACENTRFDIIEWYLPRIKCTIELSLAVLKLCKRSDEHTDVILFLLYHGADVHYVYDSPLRAASAAGHLKTVQCLIKCGATIDAENNYALRWASMYGHDSIVSYLLKHGADARVMNDCALRWACQNGHVKVTEILLSHGASTSVYTFQAACAGGHLDVVKCLVANGTDIEIDFDECLGLRWASANGHFEVVKYLVNNNMPIHHYALECAVTSGNINIVKWLIERGADVNGNYALRWASSNDQHLDIVKCLVDHGADIHEDNDIALQYACECLNSETAKYLIGCGANVAVGGSFAIHCKKVLDFETKINERRRSEAQRKIYFWMIEKLYKPKTESCTSLLLKKYNELK